MEFAKRLVKARESIKTEDGKTFTQAQLAEAIDVATGTISNWEQGRCEPTPENLYKLCDYFHCTPDYLYGRIETKTHDNKFIHDSTGLSESNIEQLASFLSYADGKARLNIINLLLEDTRFSVALTSDINSCCQNYTNWKNAEKQYHAESNAKKAISLAGEIKQLEAGNASISKEQVKALKESYNISRYNINRRFDDIIDKLLEYIYEDEPTK